MPNIKGAEKRVRVSETKRMRNKMIRSTVRTSIKKFDAAASANTDRAALDSAHRLAVQKIDEAVAKGILHKNTAARRKSKLAATLNKA